MWTRAELKNNAKNAYKRNYWICVLVSLIATMIGGVSYSGPSFSLDYDVNSMEKSMDIFKNSMSTSDWLVFQRFFWIFIVTVIVVAIIEAVFLGIFAGNMATVGSCRFYLENREHKTPFLQVFYGFRDGRYKSCLNTMFMRWLIVTAYSVLLFVPGIVKSYAYRMVPYILAENPHIGRKRALELSEAMMKGHKREAFVFDLSFFGWQLLGSFTGGILSALIVEPYVSATFAEYYTALKSEAIYKGITTCEELPGVSVIPQPEEVVVEC